MKTKYIIKKILRFLGINKPIQLSMQEKMWIKLCKFHYKDTRYSFDASNWIETLKPMFKEVYGWSPKDQYNSFLNCIFSKLLGIYLKIGYDYSGTGAQLKGIFNASFYMSPGRDYEKPIERAIAELCGLIQNNQVIENGIARYSLKI